MTGGAGFEVDPAPDQASRDTAGAVRLRCNLLSGGSVEAAENRARVVQRAAPVSTIDQHHGKGCLSCSFRTPRLTYFHLG